MSHDIGQLRADISFIRGVLEDDGSVPRASGIGLIVAGGVFGLAALRAFLLASGWLRWPGALQPLLPWDVPAVFFLALLPALAIQRKAHAHRTAAMSATSRTVWASWAAAGIGYAVAALSIAGSQAASSVLFIVAAAYRRASFAVIAPGCSLATLGAGVLSGRPAEQLLTAVAFWVLVGLPGVWVLRQARAG